MNRQDLWDSYAFSFAPNSPRRLLGLLLGEAFSTDLQGLSSRDPDRAALLAVARFEYEVKKGGFAQLLFNLRNMGVEILGQALLHAGASVAAWHYGRALAICRQMPADYSRFLASDYTAPNPLKDALHGASLDYLALAPIETEVAPLLARFVAGDTSVTAIGALPPRSLASALRDDLARGPARPVVLDAVAAVLRSGDPAARDQLFDGFSLPREQVERLVGQIMASVPEHAILLAIPLNQADSVDPQLASWVRWGLSLGPAHALSVLGLVRAAATVSHGDFAVRKPAGVWPHMPLFEVLRAALASPDAEIRAAATSVPGPWSWSRAQLEAAVRDADEGEVAVLESFLPRSGAA